MDIRILWADDEMDLLKPQLLFLENRNIQVSTVTNGHDLLEIYKNDSQFDVIFLDESMPGLSGLETLERLKKINPRVPVVMITKNEEEDIMEEAIGSNIADYLIKPVNPNQILLALKKIVQNKDLVSAKTSMDYQQEFRNLFMKIQESNSYEEWAKIYRELVEWELKIDASEADEMKEILSTQKTEANVEFSKFILRRYKDWMKGEDRPLMSPDIMRNQVFPTLTDDEPVIFLLLDNLRYDQWKVIEPIIEEYYSIEKEDYHYSILPTSTQYSRNAIFSGMMPLEISKRFPDWWIFDHEKGGKNQFEKELLGKQIEKLVRKPLKWDYVKITSRKSGKELGENMHNYLNNGLTVLVYNFIDMFSHARTEMEVLKELAKDETAYRSITKSWFLHSPLWAGLKRIANEKVRLIITTDHGTIRVKQPAKVIGDRETTTNLRYKLGKNLNFDKKDVLVERNPENIGLPKSNVSSAYIFATEDKYFLYPNNYNYYNSYYKDSFQHGGISLEEMICPFVSLRSRAD